MSELDLILWMQGASPSLDSVMVALSLLAYHAAFWILLAVLMAFSKDRRRPGIAILISLLASYVAVELVIKALIHRERPYIAEGLTPIIVDSLSYSFPSGHTAYSFASATVIAMYYGRWCIPAFALASMIGISRIYLALHWPTDVVAGALIGIVVAIACVTLLRSRVPYFREGAEEGRGPELKEDYSSTYSFDIAWTYEPSCASTINIY